MGGALQAIARSSPVRGSRMEVKAGREEGKREAEGKEGRPGRWGRVKGRDRLLHHHIRP